MKRYAFIIGVLLFVAPVVGEATGVFDAIFDDAKQAHALGYPNGAMMEYVIKEMRSWGTVGIVLQDADIKAAIDGDIATLCNNKSTPSGESIRLDVGAPLSEAGSCAGLQNSILTLIESEQTADQLGQDLIAIANGSELSIADEGDRPVNMARIALLLRRVWAGTSTEITPWDPSADSAFAGLQSALLQESDREKTVLRFRYGYFRDQREADQTMQGVGMTVGASLQAIADALHITGDQAAEGEYAVPALNANGIGLWVRKDDLGLYWIVPNDFHYPVIQPAGAYPSIPTNGETLGSPFSAVGANAGSSLKTPLCSRTVARHGFLCRPLPSEDPLCRDPDRPENITLVQCGDTHESIHDRGPNICAGIQNLFKDDGTPLIDPHLPGHLNPALTPVDPSAVCTPESKTLYQDDISSHACFVGLCIEQSLNGHSLVPNRNPVLVEEATSPFLAYLRDDPKLGLYTEAPSNAPYPMPRYIGHELLRDTEARFCLLNNKAPYPISALCSYRASQQNQHPALQQMYHENAVVRDMEKVGITQNNFLDLFTIIGQRASLDQTIEINRKVFYGLSGFVQQIADLLAELSRAPLTDQACPWTGPLTPPSS